MFGEEFWKKCCVVFTRIPMDKKSIKKRLKSGDGMSDELRAESYIKVRCSNEIPVWPEYGYYIIFEWNHYF